RPAIPSQDAGAHQPQRQRHSLHRPAHQRLIADERGIEALPRQQAHEKPHRGAGVSHVERRGGGLQAAGPRSMHDHVLILRPLDTHAERLQRPQGRKAVLARQEAADLGVTLRNSAEHERAMRDRLVAGHGELARDASPRPHKLARALLRFAHGSRLYSTARGYEPSTRNSDERFFRASSALATCGSSAWPSKSMTKT